MNWFLSFFQDRTFGQARDSGWSDFRKTCIKKECEVCGAKYFLELHHIIPFWISPDLELFPSNVVTLCGGVRNCHLRFGHLGFWKSYNPKLREWIDLIKHRP